MDSKTEATSAERTASHAVSIVTIDRLPRQPTVAAQVMRALAERGIDIDSLNGGRRHEREQLVITVPAEQAALVVELASTIAARFGVGPVTIDTSWTELVIDIPRRRSSSAVVAELYEQLAERRIEARAVTASGLQVTCVVRPESSDALRGLLHSLET